MRWGLMQARLTLQMPAKADTPRPLKHETMDHKLLHRMIGLQDEMTFVYLVGLLYKLGSCIWRVKIPTHRFPACCEVYNFAAICRMLN